MINAHIGSISVSCKEGVLPLSYRLLGNNVATLKTSPDVHQAANLELLWVLVDHLQKGYKQQATLRVPPLASERGSESPG